MRSKPKKKPVKARISTTAWCQIEVVMEASSKEQLNRGLGTSEKDGPWVKLVPAGAGLYRPVAQHPSLKILEVIGT